MKYTKNGVDKKVAIVGAGITGLWLSWSLRKKGYEVTVFEKNKLLGGLAGSVKVNNVPIEKFYHHFFSSDKELVLLAKQLGIGKKIKYYESSVGVYTQNKFFPFSTPLDLLRFAPINLWNRIMMGLVTLYFVRKKSWKDLEKYTCEEFFSKLKCDQLYTQIWKPLLNLKFGKDADGVRATFLWGRIHPRAQSREGMVEKLGYFDGGFFSLFEALGKKVIDSGVKMVHQGIIGIEDKSDFVSVQTRKKKYNFDKLVFTASNKLFISLVKELDKNLVRRLDAIKYQGVNCMLLELDRSVSPVYWLNIVDPKISFAGVIEHTNLVPLDVYGSHLMYLFNYLPVEHKIYQMSDQKVFDLYMRDLKKVFPEFDKKWVKSWQLSRTPFATPIYDGAYSDKMPANKISENIFLANTSQVYPEDRNTNNGIRLAKSLLEKF